MMGITIGSAIGSDVLMGFLAPVAELPPTALAAALGAFLFGVSGIVVARVLGNPRHSVSEESVARRDAATVTATSRVVRLEDFRNAA